jgi:RNA polymerase sigma-70 factor (ECF subfamily)
MWWEMDSRELVERAKNGDQDAYTALYNGSCKRVHNTIFKILRSCPDDVEDVVQDAIFRAFKGLSNFIGDSSFNTWLHRIAVNTALMKLRSNSCSTLSKSIPLEFENEDGEMLMIAEVKDEERGYRQFEARRDLARVMNRLPPSVSMVLTARYLDDLTLEQGAMRLGVQVNSYKSMIYRGLTKAREVMDELQKPITEQKCAECEKAGRFRFADSMVNDLPMCKWCAKVEEVTPPVAKQNGVVRTWNKICKHCGEPFVATAAAQQFAAGHKPKSAYTPKPKTGVSMRVVEPSVEKNADLQTVSVQIPLRVIDQTWAQLTVADKVRVFEFLMK